MALQFRSMKDLKERTPEIMRAARKGDVVITRSGLPVAVLHRLADAEREAYFLLKSKPLQEFLAKAVHQAREAKNEMSGEAIEIGAATGDPVPRTVAEAVRSAADPHGGIGTPRVEAASQGSSQRSAARGRRRVLRSNRPTWSGARS